MSSDCSELYARDIIFNLISQKMGERYSKTFVSGGNSGGIANLALLVSEIPAGEKETAVAAYRQILEEYSQNGFDQAELKQAVESYVSERQNPYVYATELSVFNGLLYRGDPFAFAAGSETGRYFEGTVLTTDDVAEFTPKNVQTRNERTRLVYGVKTRFHNDERLTLKPGMTLEAQFE